jgi:hypothetical protein
MSEPQSSPVTTAPTGSQRLVLALLWSSLWISIIVAISVWFGEKRWINETVVTSTPKYGEITINGQPAPIEWIDRYPRNERLWQILLLAWFYPAKILIQVQVTKRKWQIVGYGCLVIGATLWILDRLVTWDWWMCETIYSKVIGVPLLYLFVPSVFFLYDLRSEKQRRPRTLVLRMLAECLLIVPWGFAWAIIQLILGWLWI